MEKFCDHFVKLLSDSVDKLSLLNEWEEIKTLRTVYLAHLIMEDFWNAVRLNRNFPNFRHIIDIISVLPTSNAKVERSFSIMQRVKNDWRNRLGEKMLENLIRIKLDGPDLKTFDPLPYTEKFFSTTRRPGSQPTGPRQKSLKEPTVAATSTGSE